MRRRKTMKTTFVSTAVLTAALLQVSAFAPQKHVGNRIAWVSSPVTNCEKGMCKASTRSAARYEQVWIDESVSFCSSAHPFLTHVLLLIIGVLYNLLAVRSPRPFRLPKVATMVMASLVNDTTIANEEVTITITTTITAEETIVTAAVAVVAAVEVPEYYVWKSK